MVDAGDIRDLPRPLGVNGGWLTATSYTAWRDRYDAVITNPPFSLAPELIKHFLPRCDWLILLLRSSFKLVSRDYSYRDNMPDEYRLPQRPEFVASEKCEGVRPGKRQFSKRGAVPACSWSRKVPMSEPPFRECPNCFGNVQRSTTDASEYSWFVWTPERGRRFGRICVLPDTPLAERVADRGAA